MELAPRGRRVAVACCAVLACAGVPALGDDAGLPGVGDRVRVHVAGASSAPLVGTLAAMDAHSLAVKVPGRDAAAVVARADLLRVERSVRPGRKGKGALIGLGAGFAIGFVGAALLGNCDETGGTDRCVNAGWGSLYGAAAGVAGAGLGALVAPGER